MVAYRLPETLVQRIAERARKDKRTITAVVDLALTAYLTTEDTCETK